MRKVNVVHTLQCSIHRYSCQYLLVSSHWDKGHAMQTGVGKKILEARKALKISQLDLARATGSSRPTISNWENGRFAPELASINKLAAALNKPVSYFLENVTSLQVNEPFAGYGSGGNSVRLPLLSQLPSDPEDLVEAHIEGYLELPRFLCKGARYALSAPDGSGDYYLVRPESQLLAGKTMLVSTQTGPALITNKKHLPSGSHISGQVVKILKNIE